MSSSADRITVRHARFGLGLLALLLAGKVLVIAGVSPPLSWWSPVALVWQDVAVAAILGIALSWLSRTAFRHVATATYAALVLYLALTVPLTMTVGSPLTRTMMRAATTTLGDSVAHHLTVGNLSIVAALSIVAVVTAFASGHSRRRVPRGVLAAVVGVVAVGPIAEGRTDTQGLERNGLSALAPRWSSFGPRLGVGQPGSLSGTATSWRHVRPDVPDNRTAGIAASGEAPHLFAGRAADLARLRQTARGLNVVLVVLESTGARYLSPYGAAADPMPTLTALARQGLVFDNAYAVYPESVKGLVATLCGTHPFADLPAEAHATRPCNAIARSFSDAGYRTGLFHSGRFGYLGMDSLTQVMGFQTREDAGAISGVVQSSFGVDDGSTVRRMLDWIDAGGGTSPPGRTQPSPFFITYLPSAGHHPYASTAGGPFRGDGDFVRYLNALHEGDQALAQFLAGLADRGLASRTLLLVTGDHGEAFGQHPGNEGHSLFIYDENVRVPLVIARADGSPFQADGRPFEADDGPGGAVGTSSTRQQDGHVRKVVSLVDIPATLRDLAGLAPAAMEEGVSMLQPASAAALFFTDYSIGWAGLRENCWKYILNVDASRGKLFDVCVDPEERTDLTSEYATRAADYQRWLSGWAARAPRPIGRE